MVFLLECWFECLTCVVKSWNLKWPQKNTIMPVTTITKQGIKEAQESPFPCNWRSPISHIAKNDILTHKKNCSTCESCKDGVAWVKNCQTLTPSPIVTRLIWLHYKINTKALQQKNCICSSILRRSKHCFDNIETFL